MRCRPKRVVPLERLSETVKRLEKQIRSLLDSTNRFDKVTVFAMHLDTVGGNQYSADYPVYLSETLQMQFGSNFVDPLV